LRKVQHEREGGQIPEREVTNQACPSKGERGRTEKSAALKPEKRPKNPPSKGGNSVSEEVSPKWSSSQPQKGRFKSKKEGTSEKTTVALSGLGLALPPLRSVSNADKDY